MSRSWREGASIALIGRGGWRGWWRGGGRRRGRRWWLGKKINYFRCVCAPGRDYPPHLWESNMCLHVIHSVDGDGMVVNVQYLRGSLHSSCARKSTIFLLAENHHQARPGHGQRTIPRVSRLNALQLLIYEYSGYLLIYARKPLQHYTREWMKGVLLSPLLLLRHFFFSQSVTRRKKCLLYSFSRQKDIREIAIIIIRRSKCLVL